MDNFVEKHVFLCHREYNCFCNYMRVEKSRNKKEYSKIIAILLAGLLVSYCASVPFIINAVNTEKAHESTIVIDAGHGGIDSGVTGVKTGVEEKVVNLKIAIYLGEILKARGFTVIYTRRNDAMHEFDGINNNKKRADMFKRGEIINEAKPFAVVSIHQNFYSAPTRRGAQVFFNKKSEDGARLANVLQSILNAKINLADGGREYAPLCAQKYLLECSPYPSVIIECGFLSNFADERNLVLPEYQYRMASVIADGICRFVSQF